MNTWSVWPSVFQAVNFNFKFAINISFRLPVCCCKRFAMNAIEMKRNEMISLEKQSEKWNCSSRKRRLQPLGRKARSCCNIFYRLVFQYNQIRLNRTAKWANLWPSSGWDKRAIARSFRIQRALREWPKSCNRIWPVNRNAGQRNKYAR